MERDFKAAYDRLNKHQREAVNHGAGPLLVVAGAGTGKTRVITDRIVQLINKGVAPQAILALTFTEKASGEMLDRVSAHQASNLLDTTIATFNRFGNDLLQAYGSEYGLSTHQLLGETGQLVFLREHLDELELDYFSPVSNPDGQLEMLTSYVSLLKQQLVTPKQYTVYADKLPADDEAARLERQKHQELARFFATYLQLCRQAHLIDYDDQVYLTIEMLEARPNILKSLQERFEYILVDEFQDTNPMQSKLVDLLTGTSQNIMVVGDDDQSIYGWRGATLGNILDFSSRYPKTKEITLIENYRSTQSILDHAYRLIQYNNPHRLEVINKIDKHLKGQTKGVKPKLQHFTSYDVELAWVAEDIKRRLQSGQPPGSMSVLARRNQGVRKVHEALELYDVPHIVAGLSNDMYAQASVRQLIAALKSVADPNDDSALFHTLSGPLFDLNMTKLSELAGQARQTHESLSRTIPAEDSDFQKALQTIESWRTAAREQSVGSIAYAIMTDSGWKQQLYSAAEHDPSIFTQVQALASFFKTLKEFERVSGLASVQQFIVDLSVLQAAGNQFEDASLDIVDDQVNVLSVHRAKGLEWQTVYIVDCSESSFPLSNFGGGLKLPAELHYNPSQADEHIAEERRLMYVAITRARDEVILSYSDRHGSGAQRRPSRFLSELFGHDSSADAQDANSQISLELFAPESAVAAAMKLPESMQPGGTGQLFLSVSQIECWLRCPQDFYYKYVLNMPLPPAPQLAYGSLIHGVIEQVHRARQAGRVPSLKQLTDTVMENLPQTGYPSKRSRERAHAQARVTVTAVYHRFLDDELPIETEWPFQVELPNLPLTIRGKIDAVYQLEQGIEIRDFKTGTSVRTPEQAKSRVTNSQQLTLYALAWQQLRGSLPTKLSLDFVETGALGSVKKQPKSLTTLKAKLKLMTEQLSAGQYPPGHDHSHCMHPLDS